MIKAFRWFAILMTIAGFGALILSIGLHEYHYSFDPYSWLHVGGESVLTRDLWNAQKDFYRCLIIGTFILTVIFGAITATLGFLNKKINRNLK